MSEGQNQDPRLAGLERILASEAFSGAGRQARFLRYVVEQSIAGRSAEIKEYVIGTEVYDKAASFDPKIDSTVRTEASKLRSRLAAYYETEGRPDPVVISIPKGGYVPAFETRTEPPAPAAQPTPPPPRPTRYWLVAGALAFAAVTLAVSLRRTEAPKPPAPARLTNDLGFFSSPALSAELATYASDRAGHGDLDIWIQPIRGGDPLRITSDPADDTDPDLSPDGSLIAFRSEREGGGIWLVSALGGPARLFVKHGRRPRFSPDGSRIAYYIGNEHLFSSAIVSGAAFTGPVAGGEHTQAGADLSVAVQPIWVPDGKHLLVRGYRGEDFATVKMDWFIAPAEGGESVPMEARARIAESGKCNLASHIPGSWTDAGVLFSMACDGVRDVWRMPVSRSTWKAGKPERVTVGGSASSPVARGNVVAYSSSASNVEIHAVPIRAEEGRATGDLVRLTASAAVEQHPSLSRDGRKLAFTTMRAGNEDVWIKDLVTGEERAFASGPTPQTYASLNAEGTEVTWTELIPDPSDPVGLNHIVRRAPLAGGAPAKVCEHCAYMGPAPDGKRVLDLDGRPVHLALLDPATQKWTPYLRHANWDLMLGALSPDRRWIAFVAKQAGDKTQLRVAPYAKEGAPEREWADLGEGTTPAWSPAGSRIYFVSQRDGHRCLWSVKIDGVSGRAVGEAAAVAHLHGAAKRIAPGIAVFRWLAVAEDKAAFPVTETSGSIWLLR